MANKKKKQSKNESLTNELATFQDTQYIDELSNPVDPTLINESNNYITSPTTEYVDELGNPIDPSLIDEYGNYTGAPVIKDFPQNTNDLSVVSTNQEEKQTESNSYEIPTTPTSASEHKMDNKEMLQGMVTFDYNDVPITDIVNSIILDATNKGASDIHFDPFDDGIKIRVRIDGELNDYSIVPLFVKKNMITRIKIISGMNITESRIPQDGAIRTELANKSIDLRVSCLPTNMGEKIVIRIMDYSMSASGVEALDFSPKNLDKVRKMLKLPNGIILITGATGSGKSTTVYSMLQKLNIEGTNIMTVEDPIEMNIGGINQVQAISEIGLTFATVLRSILRQDPDVIMIGEIRDDETARIAVRASITGHLVLSTIHTNNSLNTIERLTDMSVERYLLGTALSGIVSQKLARRLCEKCKRLKQTNEYEKELFKKVLNKDINEIYEPVGCQYCSKGYRGRIAIQEVLLLNQTIKDAITKGEDKVVLRNLVYGDNGTETMLQDGLEKVLEGKTSFEEIVKLIDLEDDLGSGTELGLENQINASNIVNNQNNIPVNASNNPININITSELLESLTALKSINNNDEETTSRPSKKKKRKKAIEADETEIKEEVKITNDDEIKILDDKDLSSNNKDEIIIHSDNEATKKSENNNKELTHPTNNEDNNIEILDNFEENINIESLEEFEENNYVESLEEYEESTLEQNVLERENIPTIELTNIDIKEDENTSLEDVLKEFNDNINQINKKKFPIKTKELINKLSEFDPNDQLIIDNVKTYINAIKENKNLKLEIKQGLMEAFNKTFGLSEKINTKDDIKYENIDVINNISLETDLNALEEKIDDILELNEVNEEINADITHKNNEISTESTKITNIMEIENKNDQEGTFELFNNKELSDKIAIDINNLEDFTLELIDDEKKDEKVAINIADDNSFTLKDENNVSKNNIKEITSEDIEDADFNNIDDSVITSLITSLNENKNENE